MSSREIDFVKAQLARLPTRRDQAFNRLLIVVLTAFGTAALVVLWFELFWRYCPPRGRR
jgi:cell division septal protein FtsQ